MDFHSAISLPVRSTDSSHILICGMDSSERKQLVWTYSLYRSLISCCSGPSAKMCTIYVLRNKLYWRNDESCVQAMGGKDSFLSRPLPMVQPQNVAEFWESPVKNCQVMGVERGVSGWHQAKPVPEARPSAGAWEQHYLCLEGNSGIPCCCQSVMRAFSNYTDWCWHWTSQTVFDFGVCCLNLHLILLLWFWEFIFPTKGRCICGKDTRCFEHFSCASFLLMKMIVHSW